MARDVRRRSLIASHSSYAEFPLLRTMSKLFALTLAVALPQLALAQSSTHSVKQCVSTPGVNLGLYSACESLRSQLLTELTPGRSVQLSTQIGLPASGTDSNGNPTGTFATSTSAGTNAAVATDGAGGAAGASPGSTGGSGAAAATSGGGSGGGESNSSTGPSTTSGAAGSSSASTSGSGAGGLLGGLGGAATTSSTPTSSGMGGLGGVTTTSSASTSSVNSNGRGTIGSTNPSGTGAGAQSTGAAGSTQKGAQSDPHHYRNHVVIPAAVVGAVVGVILIALLICCCLFLRRRKSRRAAAAAAYGDDKEQEDYAARGGLGHSLEAGGVGAGAAGLGAVAGAGAGAALLGSHEKSTDPDGYGLGKADGYPRAETPPRPSHDMGLTALPLAPAAASAVGFRPTGPGHQTAPLAGGTGSGNADPNHGVLPAGMVKSGYRPVTGPGQQALPAPTPAAASAVPVPGQGLAPVRYYGQGASDTGSGYGAPIPGPSAPIGSGTLIATKAMAAGAGAGAGVSAAGLAGAAAYRNRKSASSSTQPPSYASREGYGNDPTRGVSGGRSSIPEQAPTLPNIGDNTGSGSWLDERSLRQSGQTQYSLPTDDEGYARSDSDTMGPTATSHAPAADPVPPVPHQHQGTGAGARNEVNDPFSTPPERLSDEETLPSSNFTSTTTSVLGFGPTSYHGAARQVTTNPPSSAVDIEPPRVGEVVQGPWRGSGGSSSYTPYTSGEYGNTAAAPAVAMGSAHARPITPASQRDLALPNDGRIRGDGNNLNVARAADNRVYSGSNYGDEEGTSEIEDGGVTPDRQSNHQVRIYPTQDEASAFDFGPHASPRTSGGPVEPANGGGFSTVTGEQQQPSQNRWSIPRKPVGSGEG